MDTSAVFIKPSCRFESSSESELQEMANLNLGYSKPPKETVFFMDRTELDKLKSDIRQIETTEAGREFLKRKKKQIQCDYRYAWRGKLARTVLLCLLFICCLCVSAIVIMRVYAVAVEEVHCEAQEIIDGPSIPPLETASLLLAVILLIYFVILLPVYSCCCYLGNRTPMLLRIVAFSIGVVDLVLVAVILERTWPLDGELYTCQALLLSCMVLELILLSAMVLMGLLGEDATRGECSFVDEVDAKEYHQMHKLSKRHRREAKRYAERNWSKSHGGVCVNSKRARKEARRRRDFSHSTNKPFFSPDIRLFRRRYRIAKMHRDWANSHVPQTLFVMQMQQQSEDRQRTRLTDATAGSRCWRKPQLSASSSSSRYSADSKEYWRVLNFVHMRADTLELHVEKNYLPASRDEMREDERSQKNLTFPTTLNSQLY